MTTIYAYWPDKTYSILECRTMYQLFWALDSEGDPGCASLRILPRNYRLTTNNVNGFVRVNGESVGKLPKLSIEKVNDAISNFTSDHDEQKNWIRGKTILQASKLVNR